MKLQVTKYQLNAIMNITDEASAMIGSSDEDITRILWIKAIDRMLKKNGLKRLYE